MAYAETCEEDFTAVVGLVRRRPWEGKRIIWANLLDGACFCHRLIHWLVMWFRIKRVSEVHPYGWGPR